MKYSHRKIEQKWQTYWQKNHSFVTKIKKNAPKKYLLNMFPYPSGPGLHVGHLRGWTASDIIARMYRMRQYNVFHPMGWDAFGLPAEQYAQQTGQDPHDFTIKNINHFRRQIQAFGLSFDWSQEVNTAHPHYYQLTQTIFSWLFQQGLAYRSFQKVNYCPKLKTVLANEEIQFKKEQLVSKRHGFPVQWINTYQWLLKITQYAQALFDNLATLQWPTTTKKLQRNWIGLLKGQKVRFVIKNQTERIIAQPWIFCKNTSQITATNFLIVSVNADLWKNYRARSDKQLQIQAFLKKYRQIPDPLRCNSRIHPVQGIKLSCTATPVGSQQILSIWLVNYLSSSQNHFYRIGDHQSNKNDNELVKKYRISTVKITPQKQKIVYQQVPAQQIHLHDWIFTRQRYWGEPMPIYYHSKKRLHPLLIPESQLPVLLPPLSTQKKHFWQKIKALSQPQPIPPLWYFPEWKKVIIDYEKKIIGYRELTTMPQWAGSCWYYLAYLLKIPGKNQFYSFHSTKAKQQLQYWLPVDLYIGGQEHATSHLLYARFWHQFLYQQEIVYQQEPFTQLFHQGMILASDGTKMSKSKNNGVLVDQILFSHGADATRLCVMFLGSLDMPVAWSRNTLDACRKWLDRIYTLVTKQATFVNDNNVVMTQAVERVISTVTHKIKLLQFNTAIAELMIFVNTCYQQKHRLNKTHLANFIKILSCFAPHLAQELWNFLGYQTDLTWEIWPTNKPLIKTTSKVKIMILINNQFYKNILVPRNASKVAIKTIMEQDSDLISDNIKYEKVIIVPNRVVNILKK